MKSYIFVICLLVCGCQNETKHLDVIETGYSVSSAYMSCGKPWYRQISSTGDIVTIEWGCAVTNKMDIVRNMFVRGILINLNSATIADSVASGIIDPGNTVVIKRTVELTKEQAVNVAGIAVEATNY